MNKKKPPQKEQAEDLRQMEERLKKIGWVRRKDDKGEFYVYRPTKNQPK